MKLGGGVLYGSSRSTALPSLAFRHGRASKLRFSASSSSSHDHMTFIKEIAGSEAPENLSGLMKMLKIRGDTVLSPGAKQGLIPLAIPLARSSSGSVTALLRWPTAPPGLEMPVVEVKKHGVWLLAKNVDQLINRILAEADANNSSEDCDEFFHSSADLGEKFYKKGDFTRSPISNLDAYLLKHVGLFPDILERKVMRHFEEGDQVSALVTGEFYTKKQHFPGFARPIVFNAELMLKVGRTSEAKDAARGALKSPWWTLGCKYEEVAKIAQWEDEQIEYFREKVTEEGRQEDLNKGKAPAQVALDEAAFLLDLASVDGSWDDCVERIAECYTQGGLSHIARFVLYKD